MNTRSPWPLIRQIAAGILGAAVIVLLVVSVSHGHAPSFHTVLAVLGLVLSAVAAGVRSLRRRRAAGPPR